MHAPALASITQSLTDAVVNHGVWAVFVLMAVDALLPVGGELIMVVAGAIAAGALAGHPGLFGHELGRGLETYVVLAVSGTLGSLVGALAGWRIGQSAGREVVDRWGRYVHLGPRQMDKAERWFDRHGAAAVLFGRLTPLVRSFISIPAGLFGEPLVRYILLTLVASVIWCFGFAGAGWALGSSYKDVDKVTHLVEVLVAVAVVATGVTLWRRRSAAA